MPYLAGFTTPQDFGAVGNGSTDDTAAINAALSYVYTTYGGGIVILPVTDNGYLVSAPVTPPPYTFLVGQTAITLNLNLAAPPTAVSRLIASAAWAPSTTAGVVSFLSLTPGGWGENWASGGLRQIFIDGSQNSNTNLQGVQLTGPVYDVHLEDVFIWKAPHNGISASSQTESGITATFPYHQRYDRVTVANCGNSGFNLVNFTDSSFVNCLAFGSVGNGFALQNNSNSVFTACRSEWSSGGRGWDVTGTSGSIVFTGCTTDQNFSEGLRIHAAAGQSAQGGGIIWTGGKLHLDGNGGTNPNGIKITGSTVPVTITGTNVESGQASSLSYFPTNAVEIDTSSNVTVIGSVLQGVTSAWSDGGTNTVLTRIGCIGATGNAGSQTLTVLPNLSSTLVIGATAPLGDNGVGEIQLANASTVPSTNPTGGVDVYSTAGKLTTRNPQGLVQTLSSVVAAQTATNTVSGTAAETVLQTFTIPANDPITGTVYHITGYGVYTASGTPTLDFLVRWGGTAGTLIAGITTAFNAVVATSVPFWYDVIITFQSTTSCTAAINLEASTTATGGTDVSTSYIGTPATATAVTTTGSNALVVDVKWSTSTGTSITITGGCVRRLA